MQFKNLNRFRVGGTAKQMQLAVPLPRTPDGRVYRYSPNKEAHPRHFVLGDAVDVEIGSEARARMKHAPRSNQTVCPYSGVVADDDAFTHPEDRDAALATVKHAMLEDARAAFGKMFDDIANKPGSITSSTTFEASTEAISRVCAFGSQHVGGAQFALCDGSARFISENVDSGILRAISTRTGGEVFGEY